MQRRLIGLGLGGAMAMILVLCHESTQAVRDGLALCAQSVVPALFPFFVLVTWLIALGYTAPLGRLIAPLTWRLFGCSENGGSAFLLGIIGGYPIGARAIGEMVRSGALDRKEAEHLLLFCNNAGPAFILGIAGEGAFHSMRCGVWLYVIHVTAAAIIGTALRRKTDCAAHAQRMTSPSVSVVGSFLQAARSGVEGMLNICGFVVFFWVILQLLVHMTGLQVPWLIGCVELAGGILRLDNSRWSFICAAGLLGWGGISVHCQTAAMLSGCDLPMGKYLLGKLAQGALSVILAAGVSVILF